MKLDLITTINNDAFINELNKDISEFNELLNRHQYDAKRLEAIIEKCDFYLIRIDKEARKNFRVNQASLVHQYPHILKILELQRKAVDLQFQLHFGSAESKISQWNMFRPLLQNDSLGLGAGRIMYKKYWKEFKFQGQKSIAAWVADEKIETLKSYSEVKAEQVAKKAGKNDPKYLDVTQLKSFQATLKDGLIYWNGQPLDIGNSKSAIHELEGDVLLVVSRDGSIYISDPNVNLGSEFSHSSYLRGQPVLFAGTISVKEGRITQISNRSGHYKPTEENLLNFLKLLQQEKVDLSAVKLAIRCLDKSIYIHSSAKNFLQIYPYCKKLISERIPVNKSIKNNNNEQPDLTNKQSPGLAPHHCGINK